MKEEIKEGVEFLRQFLIKYGNGLSSLEIDLFAVKLTDLLLERYSNHWYETQPLKGQAFRCLRLKRAENYIDPVLDKLLKTMKLNINQLGLPNDFTLWIDPGEVSVRFGDQPGYTYSIARLNKTTPNLIVEDTGKIFDDKLTAFIRQNSSNDDDTLNSLSLEQRTISPPRQKLEVQSNETSSSSYSPCSSCASSYGDDLTWRLNENFIKNPIVQNFVPNFGFEANFYSNETLSDRSDTPNSCITTASSSFSTFSPITVYPGDDFINLESKEKELESDLYKDEECKVTDEMSNNLNGEKKGDSAYCGYVESFPYYYKLNRLYNALALQKMQADRMRKIGPNQTFGGSTFKPSNNQNSKYQINSTSPNNKLTMSSPVKAVHNTNNNTNTNKVQGYPMSPANAALSLANHQGRPGNSGYRNNNNNNNNPRFQNQHNNNNQNIQQQTMFNSFYNQFDLVKSKN